MSCYVTLCYSNVHVIFNVMFCRINFVFYFVLLMECLRHLNVMLRQCYVNIELMLMLCQCGVKVISVLC